MYIGCLCKARFLLRCKQRRKGERGVAVESPAPATDLETPEQTPLIPEKVLPGPVANPARVPALKPPSAASTAARRPSTSQILPGAGAAPAANAYTLPHAAAAPVTFTANTRGPLPSATYTPYFTSYITPGGGQMGGLPAAAVATGQVVPNYQMGSWPATAVATGQVVPNYLMSGLPAAAVATGQVAPNYPPQTAPGKAASNAAHLGAPGSAAPAATASAMALFDALDANGDGVLDAAEIAQLGLRAAPVQSGNGAQARPLPSEPIASHQSVPPSVV